MKVVQIGTNRANDDLSNYLLSNYESLEFCLLVEPFSLHIDKIKECYSKFDNVIVENVAIRTLSQDQKDLTMYYHTNEHPNYEIATTDLSHLEKHMAWCPHLQGGEVRSFTVDCLTLEELLDKHEIHDLDLLCLDVEGIDAEILLTFNWKKYNIKKVEFEHLHLGHYKNSIKHMMIGLGYVEVDALSGNDFAFVNKNVLTEAEKLKNFPSINFISIEGLEDRQNLLYDTFKKYEIDDYTLQLFKRYEDGDHTIISNDADTYIDKSHLGPVTSHLLAVKRWYENTDEEYTIFFEDDVTFDTVKYWNFTWDEFFSNLPENWECVQLCAIALNRGTMNVILNRNKVTRRDWCDWSCCAYLMKRSHAKKLIDLYIPEETFHLDYKGWDRDLRSQYHVSYFLPTPETLIYTLFEENKDKQTVYTFPLFVENINFDTSWCDTISHASNSESLHNFSRTLALDWWKSKGSNMSIRDIINKNN